MNKKENENVCLANMLTNGKNYLYIGSFIRLIVELFPLYLYLMWDRSHLKNRTFIASYWPHNSNKNMNIWKTNTINSIQIWMILMQKLKWIAFFIKEYSSWFFYMFSTNFVVFIWPNIIDSVYGNVEDARHHVVKRV